MHLETYAAKGEFEKLTLARGRRLLSYFAKLYLCHSMLGAFEVLRSTMVLEMVQTLTFLLF